MGSKWKEEAMGEREKGLIKIIEYLKRIVMGKIRKNLRNSY
jgi:hypothetical protein